MWNVSKDCLTRCFYFFLYDCGAQLLVTYALDKRIKIFIVIWVDVCAEDSCGVQGMTGLSVGKVAEQTIFISVM